MSLGFRVSRQGSALGIAQKLALSAYLVPSPDDVNNMTEISGSGMVVPYDGWSQAGRITKNPPKWVCNGALSQADTPILSANRPPNFSVQLWAQVTNTAGLYAFGTIGGADTFIRTAVGDLRVYIIASDGSGNFIVSSDQTPALGTWHLFSITAAPNDLRFYIDKKLVGQVAKTARADANFRFRYNYSGAAHILGVSMLYKNATLSAQDVAMNYDYMNAKHKYA